MFVYSFVTNFIIMPILSDYIHCYRFLIFKLLYKIISSWRTYKQLNKTDQKVRDTHCKSKNDNIYCVVMIISLLFFYMSTIRLVMLLSVCNVYPSKGSIKSHATHAHMHASMYTHTHTHRHTHTHTHTQSNIHFIATILNYSNIGIYQLCLLFRLSVLIHALHYYFIRYVLC